LSADLRGATPKTPEHADGTLWPSSETVFAFFPTIGGSPSVSESLTR
jgi:hypothetical protein